MKVKKINHQKFKDPASKTAIDIQYFENQGHACDFSEVALLALPLLLAFLLSALLLLPHDVRLSLDGSSPDASHRSLPQFRDLDQWDLGHLECVLSRLHVGQVG